MSLPNIPNITPVISLNTCETINLLLSSIAMEEIALSHILNAEGEKLQEFLKTTPKCFDEFIQINDSLNKTLRTVVKSQILLEFKLEEILEFKSSMQHDNPHSTCHDKCFDESSEESYGGGEESSSDENWKRNKCFDESSEESYGGGEESSSDEN